MAQDSAVYAEDMAGVYQEPNETVSWEPEVWMEGSTVPPSWDETDYTIEETWNATSQNYTYDYVYEGDEPVWNAMNGTDAYSDSMSYDMVEAEAAVSTMAEEVVTVADATPE